VKIGEEGDVLVKNPAIFSHYLNEDDRGKVVDGWISIGDYGHIEDGHLYILDRLEDIITADNGEHIYPKAVENRLKSSPYIQEAVCIGKDRPYMTAILNIDMNSVGRWADKNRINYTAYSDLSRHPKVIEFIKNEVINSMQELPEQARVMKFLILHKQLNANDGELTRTLKVRRRYVLEKYHLIIDDMYSNLEEVQVKDQLAGDSKETIEVISLQVIQLNIKQEVA